MQSNNTNIFLLRHGLPEGDKCLRGVTDFDITQKGLMQMSDAVTNLRFDAVVTSPLKRCFTFAEQLSLVQKINLIVCDGLTEMNFGDWDGQPFTTLFSDDNNDVMGFFESPYDINPPNGETMLHFHNRVSQSFDAICKQRLGKNVLIVTHAGVMREIVQFVLGIKQGQCHQTIHLDYASLIQISVIEDNEQLYFRLHL
jgi:alpha-ribazole phosphatase